MLDLELVAITKRFGAVPVLGDASLAVEPGQLVVLLGPSGCGKTTLLRIIAGFVRPDGGTISIRGVPATDAPPHRRNIGFVYQHYALFPHLTVSQNVSFGLEMRGLRKGELMERVGRALDLVGLGGMERRYPATLSGGQQQRVALARALVIEPTLLLLDEPLSNLDHNLRVTMRREIRQLQQRLGITTILVTHDQGEAFAIADRIAVIDSGCIVQFAAPSEIYDAPASRFVAKFVGHLNEFPATILAGGSSIQCETARGLRVVARGGVHVVPGDRVWLGLRPENVLIGREEADEGDNIVTGVVEDTTYLGGESQTTVRLCSGEAVRVVEQLGRGSRRGKTLRAGQTVELVWSPDDCLVFPTRPAADEPGREMP